MGPEKIQLIIKALSEARSLSHLSEEKVSELTSMGEYKKYKSGETIIKENHNNKNIYFIIKGSVSVYSGSSFVCRYGRSGDIFGEMSVVSGSPTSASVITNEETEVFIIDGGFIRAMESSSDNEFVALFYKIFSLTLLEKLKLTTLKARLFEDASRHSPLYYSSESDVFLDQSVERQLSNTLMASLALHASEQPIIITDSDSRVIRFNLAAESMFSMVELQMLGKKIKTICDEFSYQNIYPKIFEGEINSWSGRMLFQKLGGEKFDARVTISRIINDNDEFVGTIFILNMMENANNTPVTDQSYDSAVQMENASHNIRNLLSIIMMNFTIIKNNIIPEEFLKDSAVLRIERNLIKCIELFQKRL